MEVHRRLRQAGWVVAAATHPGIASVVRAHTGPLLDIDAHRRAALDWLLEANTASPGRMGFSLGYFLDEAAWQPPYVETTGYILPTLLRAARHADYRRAELHAAVTRSAKWLVNVQFKNGAFGGSTSGAEAVFDSGQVIFGLLAAHGHTGDAAYLEAADRAGRWLCAMQDADGAWRRHAYHDRPHAYYAEVAWALLRLWRTTGEVAYRQAAERHLDWVLARQAANGFFREASFDDGPPVLHTIGYALQGTYEAGRLLGNERMVAAARRAADALVDAHTRDGPLRAYYNEAWMPVARSRCLTGLAQVALVWVRLFQQTGDDGYRRAARTAVDYLRRHQLMRTSMPGLRGGLCGSAPVWGRYFPLRLPNWGAKFYLDLLLFAASPSGPLWSPTPGPRATALYAEGA
jgi:hypothetical protein